MEMCMTSRSIMRGDMNPPTVQIAIPIAVAVDRTGVGKSSAATRNTATICNNVIQIY